MVMPRLLFNQCVFLVIQDGVQDDCRRVIRFRQLCTFINIVD